MVIVKQVIAYVHKYPSHNVVGNLKDISHIAYFDASPKICSIYVPKYCISITLNNKKKQGTLHFTNKNQTLFILS